jgi:hypothetical protein
MSIGQHLNMRAVQDLRLSTNPASAGASAACNLGYERKPQDICPLQMLDTQNDNSIEHASRKRCIMTQASEEGRRVPGQRQDGRRVLLQGRVPFPPLPSTASFQQNCFMLRPKLR